MTTLKGYVSKNSEDIKPSYWIWHSEKTKTTCINCSKHDGKKFYREEDIPELPVHPNCKCWVEPIYENSNNKEIDIQNLQNELYNASEKLQEINSIQKEAKDLIQR